MQTKEYSMTLDMKRTLPFRPFEVVEGDTGNVLHITLQNDGEPMDLTGCGLCIVLASSAGFAIQDLSSGVFRGEEPGDIIVKLNPAAYGAGNVSADVQVYSGENDETLITSTRFDFRCRRSMISEDIMRANTAYPPLVTATAAARAAAAEALAAAERVGTDIGELNVQADWAVTDTDDDAYIRNKPLALAPSAHSGSHAEGGADSLSPESIGAAPSFHASQHAASGADPVSPAAIGAAALVLEGGAWKVAPQQLSAMTGIISGDYLLAGIDAGKLLEAHTDEDIVVTVPHSSSVPFTLLTEIEMVQFGTGAVTFAAEPDVELLSLRGARTIAGQYGVVALKKMGNNQWLLAGALR